MASLKEALQKLESQSNVVANVDFTTGSTVLMDSLLSRKRRYVRDADENEDMIASISMGEPISRYQKKKKAAIRIKTDICIE